MSIDAWHADNRRRKIEYDERIVAVTERDRKAAAYPALVKALREWLEMWDRMCAALPGDAVGGPSQATIKKSHAALEAAGETP